MEKKALIKKHWVLGVVAIIVAITICLVVLTIFQNNNNENVLIIDSESVTDKSGNNDLADNENNVTTDSAVGQIMTGNEEILSLIGMSAIEIESKYGQLSFISNYEGGAFYKLENYDYAIVGFDSSINMELPIDTWICNSIGSTVGDFYNIVQSPQTIETFVESQKIPGDYDYNTDGTHTLLYQINLFFCWIEMDKDYLIQDSDPVFVVKRTQSK